MGERDRCYIAWEVWVIPIHLSIESETQVIGFSYKNVTIRFCSCFLLIFCDRFIAVCGVALNPEWSSIPWLFDLTSHGQLTKLTLWDDDTVDGSEIPKQPPGDVFETLRKIMGFLLPTLNWWVEPGFLNHECPQEPEEEEACNEVCGLSQGSTQASEVVASWCCQIWLKETWNGWRYDIKYDIKLWHEIKRYGMIGEMIWYDMNWYEEIVLLSLTTSLGHVEAYLPCQSSSHFHVLLSRFDSWDAWC